MICHSAHSDDCLWYLNSVKNEKKKTETHPNTKFPTFFEMVGSIKNIKNNERSEVFYIGLAYIYIFCFFRKSPKSL